MCVRVTVCVMGWVCRCRVEGSTMWLDNLITNVLSPSSHPTPRHPLLLTSPHILTSSHFTPSHSSLPHTPSPVLAPSSSPSSSSKELSSPITRPTPVDRMERPETLATRSRPIGSKLSSRRGWGGVRVVEERGRGGQLPVNK